MLELPGSKEKSAYSAATPPKVPFYTKAESSFSSPSPLIYVYPTDRTFRLEATGVGVTVPLSP